MKTLIIANFPEEGELFNFQQKFAAELKRPDVIFIENPKSIIDFEDQLESYQGQFDRVVVSSHGASGEEIPSMSVVGEYPVAITDVIKAVNEGNEKTLKKIHLTSCFIGSNFDKIEQEDSSSRYYLELNESLQNDQILFLHGDSYTGDVRLSLDQRLKGIVESQNYSLSEAVFDSTEAISVVVKKHLNLRGSASLKTFSYQVFGRNYEEFSTSVLMHYLDGAVRQAIAFETDLEILNGNASKERLKNLSEEDLQQYLSKRFQMETNKVLDGNLIEMAETLFEIENLNFVTKDGWTALMFAIAKGNTEIVKLLLEKEKIDLNLVNKDGATALMFAANQGYTEIVKLLLENEKINPNVASEDGWTALMLAANQGYTEAAKLILENKEIDPNLVNKDGATALTIGMATLFRTLNLS